MFIAIRGSLLKNKDIRFDESLGDFHFYDLDFCINLLMKTEYKFCVADILLQHKSTGMGSLTEKWYDSKEKFINKYKGLSFPITTQSIKGVK